MSYRGPNTGRIAAQHNTVLQYAGEPCVWCRYVSASSGTTSGYLAGGGTTRYYTSAWITGHFAAPQMGESRFRETQLPVGQVIAGDAVLSTRQNIGQQDVIVWRGVQYRIEGANVPIHLGGRLWYRTVLRRGDATG